MRAIELFETNRDARDLRKQVSDIVDWAKQNGVGLKIDVENDALYLVEISRLINSLKGAGAKVMKRLCDFADEHELEIVLHAAHGMRRLVSYYESFGFEIDDFQYEGPDEGEEHPEADEDSFGYDVSMYRLPRTKG